MSDLLETLRVRPPTEVEREDLRMVCGELETRRRIMTSTTDASGVCPKCEALIYLDHPHMCSGDRDS